MEVDDERDVGTIYVIDPLGSKSLTTGTRPALSPDGEKVAYCTGFLNAWGQQTMVSQQVRVVGADGSGGRELTHVKGGACDPDWSPDGEKLAITTYGSRQPTIAVLSRDGDNVTPITEGQQARWSPDGKQLAFCRAVGTHKTVSRAGTPHNSTWIVQADGTGAKKLWEGPSTCPTWLPDGKGVIFSSSPPRKKGVQRSAILRINLDGTGLEEIMSDEQFEFFRPVLSPDSKELIAAGQPRHRVAQGGSFNIAIIHGSPDAIPVAFSPEVPVVSIDLASHQRTVICHGDAPSVIWEKK